VLTNVVGFDVKVWDPTAPTYISNGVTVVPGDIGYPGTTTGLAGAYVDLGSKASSGTTSLIANRFTGKPIPPKAGSSWASYTWDTWPTHYDYDSQDTNGTLDSVSSSTSPFPTVLPSHGIDDINERVTAPPYPYPLRGIQVKIRVYEPDSRQV